MHLWLDLPPKIRWKLFRQFQSPEQARAIPSCQGNNQPVVVFQWTWHCQSISVDACADKLLLKSVGPDSQSRQCEAVALMPPARIGAVQKARATACISSQPGCGVGCPFCATGKLGYQGNLTATEIAEQVYWVGRQAAARGRQLRNVVYMGMGEPLHNFQHVMESLRLLTHPGLFGLPQRRIMVSTVGVPSAMIKLIQHFPKARLALSLHSADQEQRRQLVPKAVADLDLLRHTIRQLNQLQSENIWLEVVMLSGLNDTLKHAELLVKFCDGLRVEVNLIPYNPIGLVADNSVQSAQYNSSSLPGGEFTGHGFNSSCIADREAFAAILRSAGIRTSIRTSFGKESSAACGQLRANANG